MSASELDTAQQFQEAVEGALRTGDLEPVIALVAPDVECVTPVHSVYGVDAFTAELRQTRPSDSFDVELEGGDWKPLGSGRYLREIRAHFRSKATGDLSYSRDRSFELTIREGKISRYEMRFDG